MLSFALSPCVSSKIHCQRLYRCLYDNFIQVIFVSKNGRTLLSFELSKLMNPSSYTAVIYVYTLVYIKSNVKLEKRITCEHIRSLTNKELNSQKNQRTNT